MKGQNPILRITTIIRSRFFFLWLKEDFRLSNFTFCCKASNKMFYSKSMLDVKIPNNAHKIWLLC